MDGMYAVDGQKHAWAGHSCGAVKDTALFFPHASPSGKAEGSADFNLWDRRGIIIHYIYTYMLHPNQQVASGSSWCTFMRLNHSIVDVKLHAWIHTHESWIF